VQAHQEIPNVPDHLRKMVSSAQCPLSNFLAVFPLNGAHRGRLVGTVHDKAAGRRDELTWDDVSKRVIEGMQVDVERVNWFSTSPVISTWGRIASEIVGTPALTKERLSHHQD